MLADPEILSAIEDKKPLCSSCCGLGYTHHQRIFSDGYELDKEQNCLICNGTGYR